MEEINDIAKVATLYFESIYSSRGCNQLEECIDAVPCKVTGDMVETLSREFGAEEIKAALFQMGPTKAPRPNGMNALFYQNFGILLGMM